MRRAPLIPPLPLFAILAAPAEAIVIRTPDSTINVRLGGMPTLHAENANFPLGQDRVRAIGWPQRPDEWTRQMALISPYHFVFATHYAIPEGWSLNFQLPGGTLATRPILKTVPVLNSQGQATDLLLGTLQTPILKEETQITPFPVANLPTDASYLGRRGWVFGKVSSAGRGTLAGFATLAAGGFNHTRYIYYDYKTSGGAADDCYFEGGDSGSPTLIEENGQLALVGTHSYLDSISAGRRNYDAFIPDYLPQLDAMMEAEGYHVKRLYPAATTVTVSSSVPVALLPGHSGSTLVSVTNTGAADAHNLALSLHFTRPTATLSGDGWIVEQTGDTTWKCRRGGIPQGATAPLTVSWLNTGETGTIKVTGAVSWDGAAEAPLSASVVVGSPLYAEWTGDIVESGIGEDADRDGINNLLEYALGGDPLLSSRTAIGGYPLLPDFGEGSFRFAKRTDAGSRDLTYHIETSTDLLNWTHNLPEGTEVTEGPLSEGFNEVRVTPPSGQGGFYRLRIEILP